MDAPRILGVESGVPGVEVLFESGLEDVAALTVWRLTEYGEAPVRGAVRRPIAGQLTLIDWEVPFGTAVTYRGEGFAADGTSLGYTPSATLPASSELLPHDEAWVHNPLDPQGAVRFAELARTGEQVRAPHVGEQIWLPSSRVGVFLSQGQQGVSEIDLSIAVDSLEDRAKVLTMLGRGALQIPPILCFRFDPRFRRPLARPFYAVTPDYAQEDLTVRFGGEIAHFIGTGDETRPPAPALFVPLLTYGDINAAYATYADLAADNLTYGAVNRRYDLATGGA